MGILAAWQGVLRVIVLAFLGGESPAVVGATILAPFASVPDSMCLLFRLMIGAQSDDEEAALDRRMGRTPTIMFGFVSSCSQLGPCPPS